ncbi:uncharacterized protein LOC118202716 [Stegodyphus dumicola]|uniref:uncharacterized protein LOC118202716 n=1 Tax=Stegodyphus dumicola TaxID=202533 RepID=UPI0015AF8118|nr:uncharacterized protein LOC118202716 [Stegodyphus dumicola]
MHEIDIVSFKRISDIFVTSCLSNEETKAFGEYFYKNYMSQPEKWAYCYRIGLGVNTNMKVERWHKQLKYEHGNAKVIKRLDYSLSLVLNAIARKLMNRAISLERHKLTTRVTEIRKRHRQSMSMPEYQVIEIEPKKQWSVSKAVISREITFYDVRIHDPCACSIRCDDCNICIHAFSCTCIDYSIRFSICKHIHHVCQNQVTEVQRSGVTENDEFHSDNLVIDVTERDSRHAKERSAIVNEITSEQNAESCESIRQETMKLFENLSKNVATIEGLRALRCDVLSLYAKYQSNYFIPVSSTNNRNINPQRRF